MVSLLAFANITESGVEFASPFDGKLMLLTPEHSMHIQNTIGSDIMMQLDDVVMMPKNSKVSHSRCHAVPAVAVSPRATFILILLPSSFVFVVSCGESICVFLTTFDTIFQDATVNATYEILNCSGWS
jgi:hypothetical protein